jgi:hypothetical protein
MKWVVLALCMSLMSAAKVSAIPAPGQGYALVVGSNIGGPGQGKLRYAEEDAKRVAEVLSTLGGYEEKRIERLVQPSAAELRAALDRMRERIEPLAQSGEQARFFFYYSGHARADGLNLGDEQLPLAELRERIVALPATLSIVVLDGCQSGAFSRVKGADKAADFSWNSLARLNSEGIAVIASSSAKELSQESDALRSGYFTHHWLVALRGGGDRDADGRVTLSEAYQYAYNHTLANTAQTAVGGQHPTLETNIRGKDDVALTHPAAANTRLRIPASFEGRALVQRLPAWTVWAELDKALGSSVVLALPAGQYAITLRRPDGASRCTVMLHDGAETALEKADCSAAPVAASEVKGGDPRAGRHERWRGPRWDESGEETWWFDAGIGPGGGRTNTAYLDRLNDFGFQEEVDFDTEVRPRFALNLQRRLGPNFAIGLSYFNLHSDDVEREIEIEQRFEWNAHAVSPFVQGDLGFGRGRKLNLFARLGVGMSIAWTTLDAVVAMGDVDVVNPSFQDTTVDTREVTQHYFRPCGWVGLGLQATPWRYFGFQGEFRYALAPAIENELGESHDLGGPSMLFGIHLRIWE